VLYYVVLCCIMLCCVVLYYVVLCCVVSCYVMLSVSSNENILSSILCYVHMFSELCLV